MKPDELRRIRKRMGLTQLELAEEIGVARNTVTRWEMGLVAMPGPMAKLIRLIAAQRKAGKKGGK